MNKRAELRHSVALVCALVMTAAAWSQVPAQRASTGTDKSTGRDVFRSADQQQRLRTQLADPKQRQRIITERLSQQRYANPDLARVLRLDAAAENKLLLLLVEQQLAQELRNGPFGSRDGSVTEQFQQDAALYDQELRDVVKLIGAAQLDTYVDYARTRGVRMRVQAFDASLPAELKLSNRQKDRLVPLLEEQEELRLQRVMVAGTLNDGDSLHTSSEAEQRQRSLQRGILYQELNIRTLEITNNQLAKQLPQVLSPEQTQRLMQRELQPLASMVAQAQQLRREAGIGPQEKLQPADGVEPQVLAADARFEVTLTINGLAVTKAATSKAGALVSFGTVGGLSVEAQAFQSGPAQIIVDLRFYEAVGAARRLVGRNVGSPQITNPRPAGTFAGGVGGVSVMRGRKAYVVDSHVTLTYL